MERKMAMPRETKSKISIFEKVGYGLGDYACNLVWNSLSMFILYFYTDVIGVTASVISTMMLIVRIGSGVLDMVAGLAVDKTNTKAGKARPWINWLSIPFGIGILLLFTVPDFSSNGKLIYVIATYVLINVIYTFINIPYGVLNSLLTQDQYERSVISIFRTVGATAGSLCVSVAVLPLVAFFGDGQSAWILTFAIFAIIAIIAFQITYRSTTERVSASQEAIEEKHSLKEEVLSLFKNKYWIMIFFFLIVSFINTGVINGSMIYYAQYVLNSSGSVGILSMALNIPNLLIMLFVAAPLLKKIGKRNMVLLGGIVFVAGTVINVLNPMNITLALIAVIIKGAAVSLLTGMQFALLADTIEYGEWKTGIRTQGLTYSAGNFGLKIGIGLGTAIVGWVLAATDYQSGLAVQSASTLTGIQFLFIWLPLILSLLQAGIMIFYKLDKQYDTIVNELKARKK